MSKRESQRAHATGSARGVLRRASDFAPPHFRTPVFPRGFVGCSVPVLSVKVAIDDIDLEKVAAANEPNVSSFTNSDR